MTQCGKKAYLPNLSALMSMVVFLDIIKDMYSKSSCAIKIGNKVQTFLDAKRCTSRVPSKPKLIQYLH